MFPRNVGVYAYESTLCHNPEHHEKCRSLIAKRVSVTNLASWHLDLGDWYEEGCIACFKLLIIVVIIVIIFGSTVLVRTLAASHRRFRNLIKTGRAPVDE
jgi:hypothetical protein